MDAALLLREDVALEVTIGLVSTTSTRELKPMVPTGEQVDFRARERRYSVLSHTGSFDMDNIAM